MPELPEVETVRRGIESQVVGRRIGDVTVGRERSVRRVGREAVVTGLSGAMFVNARRRGKYLLCDLDTGDRVMIHLRMSGRVLIVDEGTERPPHTHVVLPLQERDGTRGEMWFVDPRTFGEVVVYDPSRENEVLPELARLGVDPVSDRFDAEILRAALAGRRGAIKAVLLSQHVVAGIGNIYADEILHRCRMRWDRPVGSLSRKQTDLLAATIVTVLSDAIAAGGSTLDDTQYVDVEGNAGWFQVHHLVYGREGEGCVSCGKGVIKRVTAAGRSTSYCPRCQR
jgi:formamidopyrimidine-DNA glycosylase